MTNEQIAKLVALDPKRFQVMTNHLVWKQSPLAEHKWFELRYMDGIRTAQQVTNTMACTWWMLQTMRARFEELTIREYGEGAVLCKFLLTLQPGDLDEATVIDSYIAWLESKAVPV